MTAEKPLDVQLLREMLQRAARGPHGPSIAEMRRDPILGPTLRSEKEMAPVTGAFFKVLRSEPRAECLAPVSPPCSNKPILSHSIQRSGPVRTLADETNHVVMLGIPFRLDEPPVARARRVGINDATTFPGLCAQHDSSLFRQIDIRSLEQASPEQQFLLAYRAVLRELHAKRVQEHRTKHNARIAIEDANASREVKLFAIMLAYSTYVGAFHLVNAKRWFDGLWQTKQYEPCLRCVTRRTRRTSFAVSSVFTPAFDFAGRRIACGMSREALPFAALNVVPDANGSLVSVAVPRAYQHALDAIIRRLDDAADEEDLLSLVWELALRNCENLVINPAAWSALDAAQQRAIETFFSDTLRSDWIPWPGIVLAHT